MVTFKNEPPSNEPHQQIMPSHPPPERITIPASHWGKGNRQYERILKLGFDIRDLIDKCGDNDSARRELQAALDTVCRHARLADALLHAPGLSDYQRVQNMGWLEKCLPCF
jgi:hypothetical protein